MGEKYSYETGQKRSSDGLTVCGAKTRSGRPCMNSAISRTNFRCKLHGGMTPRGINSVHFRNKGRSKYIYNGDVGKELERMKNAQNLLSMADETAMLATVTHKLYGRIANNDTMPTGRDIAKHCHTILDSDNPTAMHTAARDILELLHDAKSQDAAVRRLQANLEKQGRLADTAMRYEMFSGEYMHRELVAIEFGVFIQSVVSATSDMIPGTPQLLEFMGRIQTAYEKAIAATGLDFGWDVSKNSY